jgi:hypothetical protein
MITPSPARIAFWRAVHDLSTHDLTDCLSAATAFALARAGVPSPSAPATDPAHAQTAHRRRPRPPRSEPLPRRANPCRPSNPPLIGGGTLDLAPVAAFATTAFHRAFIPGERVIVYVAGCAGLASLMAELKAAGVASHAYKVGTTRVDTLDDRMRRLSAGRYGGLWRGDAGPVSDPGWDRWTVAHLDSDAAQPSPGSPVVVGLRGIEVTLPRGLTAVRFDQMLARALAGVRLDAFATSTAGRAILSERRADPRQFVRHSPRGKTSTRATELCFLRPRDDTTRLLRVIESIVANKVTNPAA